MRGSFKSCTFCTFRRNVFYNWQVLMNGAYDTDLSERLT